MKWLYWLVGIVVAAVVAFNLVFPSYTFRYRATLTVDTPQGPKSGSGVIEVSYQSNGPLAGLSGGFPWDIKVRGIAPIVDLGAHGTLVAALRHRTGGETGKVVPILGEGILDADSWSNKALKKSVQYLSSATGKGVLPKAALPQFVWIPLGMSDPDKALPLMPREFGEFIGPVEFKSVTIEPTDDPVVERVEPAPGWLEAMRDRYGTAYGGLPTKFDFHQTAVESDTGIEALRHRGTKRKGP